MRTVERWEVERGLPVRRLPGAGRGRVYALVSELEAWVAPDGGLPQEAAEVPARKRR